MGRIVYAAAMSHVLHPPYYEKNVGPHGKRMVEELIAVVRDMGRELAARRPDALVVIADDHLNVFSFDAVPAMCVRIGRSVSRMAQEGAIEFDRALDGLAAPLDHAFLSPLTVLHGDRAMTPLVPFWVNCFVAPLPSARRCFAAGQHIARVVADGPWNVGVIATGGLSHFPELSLARVGESDPEFDRRVVGWMERGDHASLTALTTKELHATGSHELLNWMVLLGAVAPARARVRFFGEMGRIDLAALAWDH